MISSNDLRPGTTIVLDGSVWRVIEFLHVKPGKGSAFVRTKIKNVQTGNTVEKTFRAGETVPQAVIEKREMQHTYRDGEDLVFMDMENFEESRLRAKEIGDRVKYLMEGMAVTVLNWTDTDSTPPKIKVLDVELPNSIVVKVAKTDPGLKGDTATGGTKPATLETGAEVMVPLFITEGETIKVDTRTDTYLGRA
jgi:elongation factor P